MLALDLDDTIADFMGQMVAFYGKPMNGFRGSLESMYPHLDVKAIISNPNFYKTLRPIDGAWKMLHYLDNRHDLIYLSARDSELQDVTAEWLQTWGFPHVPLLCVGREGKLILLKQTNFITLLVDDMEIFLLAKQGNAIVYNQPWNQSLSFTRIQSWRHYANHGILLP